MHKLYENAPVPLVYELLGLTLIGISCGLVGHLCYITDRISRYRDALNDGMRVHDSVNESSYLGFHEKLRMSHPKKMNAPLLSFPAIASCWNLGRFHVARTRGHTDWPGRHTQYARDDRTQQQTTQYSERPQWHRSHYFVSPLILIHRCYQLMFSVLRR